MMFQRTSLLLSSLSLLSLPVSGFWRSACSVVQTGRIDPILSPGTISAHVHKFAGASNINPNSTFESLQSTECSSCEIQDDHSAYWSPQLYYAHSNGTFEEVPNEGMTVYYVGRGGNATTTVPFPPGFKMLTGDSTVRSYDNTTLTYLNTRPVADRVSFHCIDENNDIPEQHYMFDTNCVNGMRAQVNFQSCWDGVNLFLPGNAHVDYLSGIDYGVCPPSHPISIPGLFYEVLYWTNDIDQSAGGEFVFAQGDTTGYGFHGDFLNGWNMTVQTAAMSQCLYNDSTGLVSDCAPLAPSNDINFPRDCLPQPPENNEPVLGLIPKLPGCNPITSGPAPAPQEVCELDSNTPVPTNVTLSAIPFLPSSSTSFIPVAVSSTISTTSSTSSSNLAVSNPLTTFTTTSTSVGAFSNPLTTSTSFTTNGVTDSSSATTDAAADVATTAFVPSGTISAFRPWETDSWPSMAWPSNSWPSGSWSNSWMANSWPSSSWSTTFATVTQNFNTFATPVFTTSSPSGGAFFAVPSTLSAPFPTNSTIVATAVTTTNAAGAFVTTFVTVTQPITDDITITTDVTVAQPSTSTTAAAFLRGRRRGVLPKPKEY